MEPKDKICSNCQYYKRDPQVYIAGDGTKIQSDGRCTYLDAELTAEMEIDVRGRTNSKDTCTNWETKNRDR